jgi:hypothetical protein
MIGSTAPNSNFETTRRELDSRTSDGIHVQLLWHPRNNQVAVAVEDTKTGQAFEIAVGSGHHALDVFRHPYAYVAETSAAPPEHDESRLAT